MSHQRHTVACGSYHCEVKISGQKQLCMAQILGLFHVRVNFHFKGIQQKGNECSVLLPLNMISKWFI